MACAFSAGQDEETITFHSNQRIEDEDDDEEEDDEEDDDEPGKRALHLVAKGGGPLALLFLLLVAGARVDAQDDNGDTALMLACENKHAAAAAELMEPTKRAGALDLQGQYEISALHFAADVGLAGTVAKLLALGADAALTNFLGDTALMLACENKHEAAATELMEATKRAGALDLKGKYKLSALYLASEKGLAGTVAKLLALGADAMLTYHDRYDDIFRTPLNLAGNDEVKAAFVEHAEHSDITDDNKNALLLLCAHLGLASRVRAVLQAGANANHTTLEGNTALMLLCQTKQEAASEKCLAGTVA